MEDLLQQLKTMALTEGVPWLAKLVAVLVLWFVGRTIISGIGRALHFTLERRKLDATLIRYIRSLLAGSLTILLLVGLLGVLGIETTSFAALLAAAGIAIGAAWSGLLANFAAGAFLLVLWPFQAGDEIEAGEVTGIVHELGLFTTSIDTEENVRVVIGNNQLLSDTIINYSQHPHRLVSVNVPVLHGSDIHAIKRALVARVAAVPEVLPEPGVSVVVSEYSLTGPVLTVQAWSPPRHASAVEEGMGDAIHEALVAAGYIFPLQANLLLSKAG